MMALCEFLLGFLLFSGGFLVRFLKAKSSNNRPYKGPTIYPVLGNLFDFFRNRHRFLEWATDVVSRTPTKTFMVKRPGVQGFYTANPQNVEHILRTKFDNSPKGESLTFFLHDFLGNGIFTADGELWKLQRKTASYEFNTKSLRNFVVETVQWEIQNRLVPVLSNACERAGHIDLQEVLQRFAFDNICRVAFGVDPGFLHPSLPRLSFAEAFDSATHISNSRFLYVIPKLWLLMRFLNLGSEKRLRESIRVVDEFAMDIIRSRREEMSKEEANTRQDLLSRFMAAVMTNPAALVDGAFDKKRMEDEGLKKGTPVVDKTDLFLRDMIVNFMMAGRDTSSAALTWFFWLLSSRPHVEQGIRTEILQVLAARNGRTEWALFSFEELREMQYLHAALCESMRLYPPVPVDTKVAAADDVMPDGTVVRKGCFVSYGIYSMGRMESIWGQDCREFKPERWLQNGEFAAENPYKFPVFQAGPRICLGKEMAFIQMKSIVASMIHRFSVKADSEYVPKYSLSITLRMQGGLPVSVKRL